MRTDDALHREPWWPPPLALLVALGFYVVLPAPLRVGPRWLIPALELLLVVPLVIGARLRPGGRDVRWRALSVLVIALITAANVLSVILLVDHSLGPHPDQGRRIVYAAMAVWLTNVIVFGLWFWELDRGGPTARGSERERLPDFEFAQMNNPRHAPPRWRPAFFDYLYLSLTNAASFSPTDTMPLTVPAKTLMGTESLVSLITVLVIAARAVSLIR